jgi:hypothetical protein
VGHFFESNVIFIMAMQFLDLAGIMGKGPVLPVVLSIVEGWKGN